MRNRPSLVDILKSLKSKLIPPLLLGQPLTNRLAYDPALAAIDATRDVIHPGDEIVRKLSS